MSGGDDGGQPGFFDLSERYGAFSAAVDSLERLSKVVNFKVFWGPLIDAVRRSVRGKRGQPPFDRVMMFKILVLQSVYSLSHEAKQFQIKDRLSFEQFLGLDLESTMPDATTVWLFREPLVSIRRTGRRRTRPFSRGPVQKPHPPARAEPPRNARAHRQSRCDALSHPLSSRTRSCRANASHGPYRAHDRHGQPRLQLPVTCLA